MDANGYYWGNVTDSNGQADIPVNAGKTTQVTLSLSKLTVGFLYADNSIIKGQYVTVWTEKKDLAGNWVTANMVADGRTDNSGMVYFDLTPGYYVIGSDFTGYNWGSAIDVNGDSNIALQPGQQTQVVTKLGRITVGLIDSSGNVQEGKYVQFFIQRKSASGSQLGNQIADGRTDNTGTIYIDLTPGKYAVKIGDSILYDIPVESGHITTTNGVKSEISQ
jgi:hypothetical protein